MKRRRWIALLGVLLGALLAVSGCGQGDLFIPNPDAATAPSNDWGSFLWGQGIWQ